MLKTLKIPKNNFDVVLNLTQQEFMKRFMPYLYIQNTEEIDLVQLRKKKYLAKFEANQFELRVVTYSPDKSNLFAEKITGRIEALAGNKIRVVGEVNTSFIFTILIGFFFIITFLFNPNINITLVLGVAFIGHFIFTITILEKHKQYFIALLKSFGR